MKTTWKRRKYTQEEFVEAWMTSNSIAEVLSKLNLSKYGWSYNTANDTAKELGLNKNHMAGQAWLKGKTHNNNRKMPIEDLLVEDNRVSSSHIKSRIIKEGLIEQKCFAPFCPLQAFNSHPFTGKPVPLKLSLDHINGNNRDNRLENLRFLCYYCHGLTDTFCGKNKTRYEDRHGSAHAFPVKVSLTKSVKHEGKFKRPDIFCVICFKPCSIDQYWHETCKPCLDCDTKTRNLRCRPCSSKARTIKVELPDSLELLRRVKESNYTQVANELGVSTKTVRNRLGELAPRRILLETKFCVTCSKIISKDSRQCRKCYLNNNEE